MKAKRLELWLFGGLILVAAFLRFWEISNRPGWEWDEPAYNLIGHNIATQGLLQAATEYGQPPTAFLYQPPFYFLTLGGWYRIVGSGITEARCWAATMSLLTLMMLYLFSRSMFGRRTAFAATAFIALDTWMVYTNRVSWIENTLMVFIVGAMWLYWRATKHPTNLNFVIAGLGIGITVIFKHNGAYLFIAVALYWLIQRRWTKQHLWLIASATGVIGIYLLGMTLLYQHNGNNAFWSDMAHQWGRTIGTVSTAQIGTGSIGGISGLSPLLGQYKVFVGTLLVGVIAGVLWLIRLIQCLRQRSWQPVRANSFTFVWMTAGIIGLCAIRLKYPHYFVILLVPMYLFLAGEFKNWFGKDSKRSIKSVAIYTGCGAIAVLGVLGFFWRIVDQSDNALQAVAQYAQANIPASDVVLTEQPIGNLIHQPFCDIRWRAGPCGKVAKYIISYTSSDYSGPNDPLLKQMIAASTRLTTITGFKEKIIIYKR
jgi:4-amino-4-deoxy-L-arabinose transferase-like glycosyltransferase